jgi:hypothetical protein
MHVPFSHRPSPPHRRRAVGFCPHAARLLISGHILILAALCDFAARLHGGDWDALLYIEDFFTSAMGAWVILWGAGILLDYLERTEGK